MQPRSAPLHFRPLEKRDLDNIHALHLMPETDRYNTTGIPADLKDTEQLMEVWFREIQDKKKYIFILEDMGRHFVGIIGINIGKPNYRKAEIWYKVHPGHWRKGYATDAVKTILDFGFNTLQLHRIEAGCATENTGSVKVLEKSGFTKEGIERKNLPIRGSWADNYTFSILEEEYHSITAHNNK